MRKRMTVVDKTATSMNREAEENLLQLYRYATSESSAQRGFAHKMQKVPQKC
jgi:hypothetical protein